MKRNKILIVVLLLVCLALAALCLKLVYSSKQGNETTSNNETKVEKTEDSIAVPGYEALSLVANSEVQDIALANPESNTCLFKISLLLEDGTLLWQSNFIKPGKQEAIVLRKPLKAGTYENSKIVYECFKMDINKTPLNGAEAKLTLIAD